MKRSSALLLVLLFALPCRAEETGEDERHGRILSQLAAIIEPSLQRQDTSHPIFHGCVDWHSAVHGHWALLRIARATGKHAEHARTVADAFDASKVQEEADYLRAHPGFEMPYGRAWFLRLVVEYESWCSETKEGASDRLSLMGDQVAASLVRYYSGGRAPTPASREYKNDAWALVQMHAYFKHRADTSGLQLVAELVTKHYVEQDVSVRFAIDRQRADFFSPFGNAMYLLSQTQTPDAFDAFLKRTDITDEELRPVDPLLGSAHHYGVNWCRAWALRAAAEQSHDEREQKRLMDAYHEHVEAGMKHHRMGAGNFYVYDHWVPQFAVYAVTGRLAPFR